MITRLAVAGCRSLRDLRLPLGELTVVTGANGRSRAITLEKRLGETVVPADETRPGPRPSRRPFMPAAEAAPG